MNVSYLLAVLHFLTFGLGVSSIWMRAYALKKLHDQTGLQPVFFADNLWGISALLWIVTGLYRALGGLEKGTDYYLGSTAFQIKMTLFVIIFILEIKPMITFYKWRALHKRGEPVELTPASALARISFIELALLIPIVFMAAAMARGLLV